MLVITLPDIISWDTYPQKFTKWLIANFSVLPLSTTFRGAREAVQMCLGVWLVQFMQNLRLLHQFSLPNAFT